MSVVLDIITSVLNLAVGGVTLGGLADAGVVIAIGFGVFMLGKAVYDKLMK